jgi:hypothetical protein
MVEITTSMPSSVDAHINEYTTRTYRRADSRPTIPDSDLPPDALDRRTRRGAPRDRTAAQQPVRARPVLSEQRYNDIMRRATQMDSTRRI